MLVNIAEIPNQIQSAVSLVRMLGAPLEALLVLASLVVAVIAIVPALTGWRRGALLGITGLLVAGEALLVWFHWSLNRAAVVIDPSTGEVAARVAVPLWIESEKLYVWALLVAVMGVFARRQRDELLPGIMLTVSVLAASAAVLGKPFTEPLPQFLAQYDQYVQATLSGVPQAVVGAYEGMLNGVRFFYNTPYMWVHPPLLFFAYATFAISFVATLEMIRYRHSSFETTAYRWARLGYLALTIGMLLGFPWALAAWRGESWWWSGKVNMSIMMWLLYTAFLHARLYLRRKGMWKWVAALGILSFVVLVLTYVATYVVPGAHSYA
ncbi:MAG: cytochrome c biogenesis protein CcsA [Coriobacteriales bacterium]|nr:cytochrome c biogenesis protein CcsA [Coriobacteriales bacterium]